MTFLTIPFVFLFIFTYIFWVISKTNTKRKIVLLISSCIFYAWWDIRFLFLMLFLEYISYWLALLIKKTDNGNLKKFYISTGVVISLVILGFFKYFNFFRESFFLLLNIKEYTVLNIILPIGISFYTFQSLSYLIDVYRGKIEAEVSFLSVALYVSFFPQLVAGPIVRAQDFLPQLEEYKKINQGKFHRRNTNIRVWSI